MGTANIAWDDCGDTMGCVLYPRLCSGSDCKAALTFRPDGDEFVLEMFVSGEEYIAVGFSQDQIMVSCKCQSLSADYLYLGLRNSLLCFRVILQRA